MTAIDELSEVKPAREMIISIGVFDGVHPGHQHLIGRLIEKSKEAGYLSGLITFSWHPKALLAPQTELPYLTSLEERIALIKGLGVDHVVALTFTTELSQLSAREFISLLQEHMKMRGLVIGPDFALGRNKEGNTDALASLGQELGFTVDVVSPVICEDMVVSSTGIRRSLARGNVEKVNKLLGRRFRLSGVVVHGDNRGGKLLGFNTANLSVPSNHAIPSNGGYVTLAEVDGEMRRAVTNVGVRPTFGHGERTIETYVLDYDGDLYGHEFAIEFVKRLRGEMKFESLEALKAQIKVDVDQASNIVIE